MAQRILPSQGEQSKRPQFKQHSKMKRYELVYDEDVEKIRCGFMNFIIDYVPNLPEDKFWSIEPGYEYRSDLISKRFYGTTRFDWVIEQINDVRDPIKDLTIDTKLLIPSKSNIYSLI